MSFIHSTNVSKDAHTIAFNFQKQVTHDGKKPSITMLLNLDKEATHVSIKRYKSYNAINDSYFTGLSLQSKFNRKLHQDNLTRTNALKLDTANSQVTKYDFHNMVIIPHKKLIIQK